MPDNVTLYMASAIGCVAARAESPDSPETEAALQAESAAWELMTEAQQQECMDRWYCYRCLRRSLIETRVP